MWYKIRGLYEHAVYSGLIFVIIGIVFICFCAVMYQEYRIQENKSRHLLEISLLKWRYDDRIKELEYQLRTGDKRTPLERRRDEYEKRGLKEFEDEILR